MPTGRDKDEAILAVQTAKGWWQTEIASALNIKHPSTFQIERQIDMYLAALRTYVEVGENWNL